MTEEAKAVQEVAKAAGKAIDAGRQAGGFFARFLDGPLEQMSGLVTDELRYRRWRRIVRLHERSEQFLRERGLDGPTRQVPLSFAIPLLQAGTLEEDDSLQDLWAALLTNAADASREIEPRTAFISILRSFSPLDARVLAQFEQRSMVPWSVLSSRFENEKARLPASLHNLARLGCLSTPLTNQAVVEAIGNLAHAAREAVRQKVDPNRLGTNWRFSEFRSEMEALESADDQIENVHLTDLGRDLLTASSRRTDATPS